MKKVVIVLSLMVCISALSFAEGFSVKLGLNLVQEVEMEASLYNGDSFEGEGSVDGGSNLDLSYDFKFNENLEYGFGILFNAPITDDGVEATFTPIYGQVKWYFNSNLENKYTSYAIGKLGFTLYELEADEIDEAGVSSDNNPGAYLAIGGGVEFKDFLFETAYEVMSGSTDYSVMGFEFANIDTTYSRLTFRVGYNFNPGKKEKEEEEEEQNEEEQA